MHLILLLRRETNLLASDCNRGIDVSQFPLLHVITEDRLSLSTVERVHVENVVFDEYDAGDVVLCDRYPYAVGAFRNRIDRFLRKHMKKDGSGTTPTTNDGVNGLGPSFSVFSLALPPRSDDADEVGRLVFVLLFGNLDFSASLRDCLAGDLDALLLSVFLGSIEFSLCLLEKCYFDVHDFAQHVVACSESMEHET